VTADHAAYVPIFAEAYDSVVRVSARCFELLPQDASIVSHYFVTIFTWFWSRLVLSDDLVVKVFNCWGCTFDWFNFYLSLGICQLILNVRLAQVTVGRHFWHCSVAIEALLGVAEVVILLHLLDLLLKLLVCVRQTFSLFDVGLEQHSALLLLLKVFEDAFDLYGVSFHLLEHELCLRNLIFKGAILSVGTHYNSQIKIK